MSQSVQSFLAHAPSSLEDQRNQQRLLTADHSSALPGAAQVAENSAIISGLKKAGFYEGDNKDAAAALNKTYINSQRHLIAAAAALNPPKDNPVSMKLKAVYGDTMEGAAALAVAMAEREREKMAKIILDGALGHMPTSLQRDAVPGMTYKPGGRLGALEIQ